MDCPSLFGEEGRAEFSESTHTFPPFASFSLPLHLEYSAVLFTLSKKPSQRCFVEKRRRARNTGVLEVALQLNDAEAHGGEMSEYQRKS
jgi:hypothetical protein